MEKCLKFSLVVAFGLVLAVPAFFLSQIPAEVHAEETEEVQTPYALEVQIGEVSEVDDLTEYIKALYEFLVGAAGIVATTMVMWGGMKWVISAGSGQKIADAKKTIIEAIIGLVLVLGSFVILNTLNPQLTLLALPEVPEIVLEDPPPEEGQKIPCEWEGPGDVANDPTKHLVGSHACDGEGEAGESCYCKFNDNCQPTRSGSCSIDGMYAIFGDNASMASAICLAESAGDPTVGSACTPGTCTDYCSNDPETRGFSFGLFQINLRANPLKLDPSGELDCRSVFTDYVNKYQSEGIFECTITDDDFWEVCMTSAIVPANNKQTASGLSEGGKYWQHWSTNNHCGFPSK